MLSAAILLSFVSFLTELYRVRLGPGAIPAWLPFAVDATIAGVAGGMLTFGSRWFSEEPEGVSPDYVVVAKPVWESVQAEIVAARSGRRMAEQPAPSPSPSPIAPAPVESPLNPWDEGPPTPISPAHGGYSAAAPLPPESQRPTYPAEPVPAGSAARSAQGSPPPQALGSPPPVPPGPTSRVASAGRRAPTPPVKPKELSQAELEEIARMGGILGIVPLPGESGAAYSERLARAREALTSAASGPPAVAIPQPAPTASASDSLEPDLDAMLQWLDKMAAEQAGVTPPLQTKKETRSDGTNQADGRQT